MRKLVRKVLNENHALLIDLPVASLPSLVTVVTRLIRPLDESVSIELNKTM